MTVNALLDDLCRRGIRLTIEGASIKVRGPKAMLTPELIPSIRARKPELLAVLGGREEHSEAKAVLVRLLNDGCAFQIVSVDGHDRLIWFGPEKSVAPEVRACVTGFKPEIIALLKKMPRWSSRSWGQPSLSDWLRHPGWPTQDAE